MLAYRIMREYMT